MKIERLRLRKSVMEGRRGRKGKLVKVVEKKRRTNQRGQKGRKGNKLKQIKEDEEKKKRGRKAPGGLSFLPGSLHQLAGHIFQPESTRDYS